MSEMRRSSWLFCRNGRYYLRARVPQDIISIIGKREIKRSLHTSERAEGLERLAAEAAEVSELFAAARRKIKAEVEKLIPDLTDHESKRLAYLWFRKTERESIEDAFKQPELNHLALENAYEELAILLGDEEEFGPYVQEVADSVLIGAGFPEKKIEHPPGAIRSRVPVRVPNIDKTSEVYQKLCERLRRGMIENVRRQQQRLQGRTATTVDPAFSAKSLKSVAAGPTLSRVLKTWKTERKPSQKTEREWDTAVRRFRELHGDLPVDGITKAHIRDFKDTLLRVPAVLPRHVQKLPLPKIVTTTKGDNRPRLSTASVTKYLGAIKSLLSWSVANGYVEGNVATGVIVAQAKDVADKRVAFDQNDLQKIYSDIGRFREIGPAKFWLPLLAAFTGARLEELGQLTVDDVRRRDCIDFISVNADNGKTLKTKSSVRDIPIHPELTKCGLLDYVAARRCAGGGQLFPDMKRGSLGTLSDIFSKWFTRHRRSLGITDPRKVFHSFRHTFKEGCRAAGMAEEVHDALTGHANGSVGRGYGGVPLSTKAEAIQKIDYGISLDHLYLKSS
jgi:integrase